MCPQSTMDIDHSLERVETTRSVRRAKTGEFSFWLYEEAILVGDLTHESSAEHEYRITVRDGIRLTVPVVWVTLCAGV